MTDDTKPREPRRIKVLPGDDMHLTILGVPYGFNFLMGKDRQDVLAFGRAVWAAALAAPAPVAPTSPQAALLAELSDAVRAHFDLRDQIRARGMPPHPDFWHQALGEVETRLRNALDAVVEALK